MVPVFLILALFASQMSEMKNRKKVGNRYVDKGQPVGSGCGGIAKTGNSRGEKAMPLAMVVDEKDVQGNSDFHRHKRGFVDPHKLFPSPSQAKGGSVTSMAWQEQGPLAELIQKRIDSLPDDEKPPSTCEVKNMKFKFFIIHLWSMVTPRQRKSYADCLNRYLEFWAKLFESDDYKTTIQDIGAGMGQAAAASGASGNGIQPSQQSQSQKDQQQIARTITLPIDKNYGKTKAIIRSVGKWLHTGNNASRLDVLILYLPMKMRFRIRTLFEKYVRIYVYKTSKKTWFGNNPLSRLAWTLFCFPTCRFLHF